MTGHTVIQLQERGFDVFMGRLICTIVGLHGFSELFPGKVSCWNNFISPQTAEGDWSPISKIDSSLKPLQRHLLKYDRARFFKYFISINI